MYDLARVQLKCGGRIVRFGFRPCDGRSVALYDMESNFPAT